MHDQSLFRASNRSIRVGIDQKELAMARKEITPNFRTPEEDINAVERFKLEANFIRGDLFNEFRDLSEGGLTECSGQLSKSHGIYVQWDRLKKGKDKDFSFMARVSVPGGGPLTREQWAIFDDLAQEASVSPEGQPSIRLTTRQNVQYHWVPKDKIVHLISKIAESGIYTLNGCGDNTRNVMACPLSAYSNVYDANALAQYYGLYFQLPGDPHVEVFSIDPNLVRSANEHFEYSPRLLNRKFKIAFSAIHEDEDGNLSPDNCIELRTNDMGIAPILENGKVERVQVYIGGGQGERNGKPGFSALAKPLGIVTLDQLQPFLDAIVHVHEEWGDRQNRHWARIKYVVYKMGIPWYQERVREELKKRGHDDVTFEQPIEDLDLGPRMLHHGWERQPSNGLWSYGMFVECGRLMDGIQNGDLRSAVRRVMDTYPVKLIVTANQDLLFTDVPDDAKKDLVKDLEGFGYGQRNGENYTDLRRRSGACVGLYTCSLSYTESEQFLPVLIDDLDKIIAKRSSADAAWNTLKESIGITGCERQCFRPATKTIGLVGCGKERYQMKLMGSEDCSTQGVPVVDSDGNHYLKMIKRPDVATTIEALFELYLANRTDGETMGEYHNRIGMDEIIRNLKAHDATKALMEKTYVVDWDFKAEEAPAE